MCDLKRREGFSSLAKEAKRSYYSLIKSNQNTIYYDCPRQAQEDNPLMDAETSHAVVAAEVRAMQDNERTPRVLRNRTY